MKGLHSSSWTTLYLIRCSKRFSLWDNLIFFFMIVKTFTQVLTILIRLKYHNTLSYLFLTLLLNSLNLSIDLDLCLIKYTKQYIEWSWINIMKYVYLYMTWIIISSHIFICIGPNNSLGLSLFSIKSVLFILHNKQTLQVLYDS